jgi:nucleoid-associated protein YgaU
VILGFVVGFVAVRMLGRDGGANVEESAVADTAKTTVPSPKVNEPVAAESEVTANIDTIATTVDDAVTATAGTEQPVESGLSAEEVQDVYTFVMVDELAAIKVKDISPGDTLLYVAEGELARHIVAADETLVKIANKYFGDRRLWPYIVKYNNMRNPNSLRSGMEIAIPRLIPKK